MATTTLKKTLNTALKPPVPSDPMPELLGKQAQAVKDESKATLDLSALEEQKVASETEAKAKQATSNVMASEEATGRRVERDKPLLEQSEQYGKEMMKAHFEPSKENLTDQVALFSLINILGFAIGGGGKKNAQAAMSAMNGMMEGHQQGRVDVYKQESNLFDKNLKALQQRAAFVEKELSKSLQEYTRDKDAGEQRATAAFAQAQADFLKVYAQKNGLVATHARAKEILKAADKAVEDERKRKEKNEDAATRAFESKNLLTGLTTIISKDKGDASTGAKGTAAGAVERMTQSMGQASDALTNLARLPISTRNPIFGQSNFGSLFTAPLSVINQKMSDNTSQMMKTRMAAVSRTLASLETGGAATGLVGLTKSIEDGVAIPAGASVVVALDKLAEMRRIVETSSRIALSSPNYSPSQKEEINKSLSLVRTAIPYTQKDLDLAVRTSQNKGIKLNPDEKNMTFTEFVNKHGIGKRLTADEEEELKALKEKHGRK